MMHQLSWLVTVLVLFVAGARELSAQGEPQDSPAFTRRGIMSIRAGRAEEGMKDLEKAIKLDAENSLAYFWRGRAQVSMGNYQDAMKDFTKVIELDPAEPTAYVERATIKKRLEDAAGAQADMEKAYKLQPSLKDPVTPEDLVKRPENPVEPANKEMHDPSNTSSGNAKILTGKELSLTDKMGKLIELPENELLAEKYLMLAKSRPRDYRAAIALLDKAIQVNPRYAEAYLLRGIARSWLDDFKGSLDDESEAIRLNPRYAEAYATRSEARSWLKDWKGILKDIEKAIEIDPSLKNRLQQLLDSAKQHLGR